MLGSAVRTLRVHTAPLLHNLRYPLREATASRRQMGTLCAPMRPEIRRIAETKLLSLERVGYVR